jgi:hypothetical protein
MKVYTYKATVKVRNGNGSTMFVVTTVAAENDYKAMLLLEAQYGRGNVVGTPARC